MSNFITRYSYWIIGVCVAIGISLTILIPFSKTDPEIRNYVPAKLGSRVITDSIESAFGMQDMVLIMFSDTAPLSRTLLEKVKTVDRSVSRLSGVSSRISPFTVRSVKSVDGTMTAELTLRRIPENKEDAAFLSDDILNNQFARDVVFSSDLKTAAITATINNLIPETETLAKIDTILEPFIGNTVINTGGLPYVRKHIMKDVRKDAIILVPFALLIMLIILRLTLGSWRNLIMPFSVVILSAGISMGLIPLLGWKISIISLLVPIILIAVANNYGIYLVARAQEIASAEPGISPSDLIKRLNSTLSAPILFSGLTTLAGILGLLTHSIIPARQVGILSAAGVSAALLMSMFMIPALIYLSHKTGKIKTVTRRTGIIDSFISWITSLVVKWPGRVITGFVLFTIVAGTGITLLRTETNQENFFPGKHPIRIASGIINGKFGGSQTVSIMVSGDILDPEVMRGIDTLTKVLEVQAGVGKVFSVTQAVREMSKAFFEPEESGYNAIPKTREEIAQLFELYYMSGEQSDFSQMINTDNTKAHVLVKLSEPDNSIIRKVRGKITETAKLIPANVVAGGYALIMADFANSIIKGQVFSLISAILSVLILLAIIFKSVKGGFIGSVPLVFSIIVIFGFMGFVKIPLDAATALLSSIMIGVGVDFTIQYVYCLKQYLKSNPDIERGTKDAMANIGRSIIINGVSVMAGFSALVFSGFTSIRFFGYLVFISIGMCLIGALILVPALLLKFRPKFVYN